MLIDVKIPLGATVRDKLSNYEGVVTSIHLNTFGETQVGVTREGLNEMDEPFDPILFTDSRLEILSNSTILESFGVENEK